MWDSDVNEVLTLSCKMHENKLNQFAIYDPVTPSLINYMQVNSTD